MFFCEPISTRASLFPMQSFPGSGKGRVGVGIRGEPPCNRDGVVRCR